MKILRLLTVCLLVGATVEVKAQFGPQKDMDSKYATELIQPGTVAPDFKMLTLEGKKFQFSKWAKGKTVVLDFWASWCPDCRKDAPEVMRMYQEFKQKGIEFLGISMDTDVEAWKQAIVKFGITYPQVSELKKFKDTDISKAYGVKWIPSMVVVGPDGKVVLSTVLTYKVDKYLKELTSTKQRGAEERVSIDGDHGRLQAIIQKPELTQGQQCPMVVFCHGFGGTKDGPLFELICDTLQQHGIASIRFDFNGHGESEGEFKDMTVPNEIEDAKKVVEYVRDLRYVSGLAIVGHSQGGVVAAMTAGQLSEELGEPAFKAVALMAPAAVLRDDAIRGNTMGKMYDPFDPGEYVELWGGMKLGGEYIRTAFSLPIYETAAKYQGKALIVHGNADRVVPYTYGEGFHKIWPGSEYVLQEYFDHGFSQDIYRTTDIVSQFLMKVLK
ncbi:MAG: alpha/beta fold hydrolase [Prevotella sp.]|nr:alpha/beta fold hydrolase [Prevotella sp.]